MTPTAAIQRPDLGLTLDEFDLVASRLGFIGTKVFPVFETALQTANFSRVKITQRLKTYPVDRAPGSGYSRGQGEFTQDNFACKERGHEEPVDDREQAIYAYTIDSLSHAVEICQDVILREYEKRVAAKVFDTGTFTGAYTTAVGTKWSVHATATPVDDGKAAIIKVRDNFGLRCNTAIVPWKAFQDLTLCTQIVDRIKYSGRDDPKNVTPDMVAALWGIERVLIPDGQYNSANEPTTAVLSEVWDPALTMFCRTASTNNLKEVCLGRTFVFTGDGSSSPNGAGVEQYREESKRSDIVRVRMDTDEKLFNVETGVLLSNIR